MDPAQLAEVEALYAKTHMGVTWHPFDFRTILAPEACAYVAAALNAFPALAQALRAALAEREAMAVAMRAKCLDLVLNTPQRQVFERCDVPDAVREPIVDAIRSLPLPTPALDGVLANAKGEARLENDRQWVRALSVLDADDRRNVTEAFNAESIAKYEAARRARGV